MKIGIDLSMLVYAGSGVATYTFELANNLLQVDKENSYIGFYSSLRRPPNFYHLSELKKLGAAIYDYRLPPTLLRFIWGRNQLIPIEWLIGKVDIYHSSDFLRPPQGFAKGLTTVHDLTWYFYPQFHEDRIVKAHHKKMERTIKYGDEIITVSYSTKYDICKIFKIAANKVHIVYEGVDHKKFKIRNDKFKVKKVIEKYNISEPYMLYVGAIEPRKNLTKLIEAFHLLVSKNFKNLSLVVAGRAGWKNESVFRHIKQLGLTSKITFTGFVEDSDLPHLYDGASVFVYPSFYEGFGLPVLEALASGVPVVCSKTSSLPEVAGDAVIYCDPNSVRSIAFGIEKVLDSSRTDYEAMRQKSVKQASKFSWERCARETLKIYKDIYLKSIKQ